MLYLTGELVSGFETLMSAMLIGHIREIFGPILPIVPVKVLLPMPLTTYPEPRQLTTGAPNLPGLARRD